MREQVDTVIHGLEEELRALDLQYNEMLRKVVHGSIVLCILYTRERALQIG
jgi:hypothetical protein